MRVVRLTILTAVVAAACGDDDYGTNGGANCTPAATQVCMVGLAFNPTTLTVAAGATVTWRNGSGTSHTVTSNQGSPATFDSDQIGPGATFSRQFPSAGTFQYHCSNHPGMTGTIQVN